MKKVNINKIYQILKRESVNYNSPVVDLIKVQTNDPFKVLVASILSARTTDVITTKVCERLFKVVNGSSDLNNLTTKKIERLIYPVGFYKNKARFLKELPKTLLQFDNKVPDTIGDLLKINGVGRKVANLVVAVGFNKPAICVDTHVHRIMNRFGYIKTKNPLETEHALRKKLPLRYWKTINSLLVAHGQNICRPISPKCTICPIFKYCNRIAVK